MEIRPVPLDGAGQAWRTSTRNSSLMVLSFSKRCIDPLDSLSTVSKAPGLQLSARIQFTGYSEELDTIERLQGMECAFVYWMYCTKYEYFVQVPPRFRLQARTLWRHGMLSFGAQHP